MQSSSFYLQQQAAMQQRPLITDPSNMVWIQQQQQQQQQRSNLALKKPSQPTPPQLNTTLAESITQKKNLRQYMDRDESYQKTLDKQHYRHVELAKSKKQEIDMAHRIRKTRVQQRELFFGKGYDGYGNGKTDISTTRVMYPNEKKHRRQQVRIPSEQCKEQAKKQEVLVPIRLDLEHDGYKIRDTFTWNKNETFITPEQFAEITCEDLRLPVLAMSPLIAASIREQIQDFDLQCSIEQQEKVNPYQHFIASRDQPPLPEPVHDKQVDFRTIIKLDIIVGNRILHDQFEWDIVCQQNSPESFAEKMVTELGLGSEFKTAIAHSIREQVHVYLKSLLLIGHDMQTPVDHDELKRSFLPPLQNIVRRNQTVERFTPSLIELTEAEVDKIEKDRTRESRRKRRNTRNRKGVITLPEREHIPTFRTIFATPSEQGLTDEQFLKSMQTEPTLYHSQRKSAAKARQSIAAEAAGLPLIESDSMNPPSVPNTFVSPHWRCTDCGCSPYMTSLIRSSSLGENSLCNACGLYRSKFNAIRPQNYTDNDIKNDIPHLADWQNHLIKHR